MGVSSSSPVKTECWFSKQVERKTTSVRKIDITRLLKKYAPSVFQIYLSFSPLGNIYFLMSPLNFPKIIFPLPFILFSFFLILISPLSLPLSLSHIPFYLFTHHHHLSLFVFLLSFFSCFLSYSGSLPSLLSLPFFTSHLILFFPFYIILSRFLLLSVSLSRLIFVLFLFSSLSPSLSFSCFFKKILLSSPFFILSNFLLSFLSYFFLSFLSFSLSFYYSSFFIFSSFSAINSFSLSFFYYSLSLFILLSLSFF